MCSRGFEQHRVVTAFNASRGLKLHSEGSREGAAGHAASEREAGLRLPGLLCALLRVGFWRANPRYSEQRRAHELGVVGGPEEEEARPLLTLL